MCRSALALLLAAPASYIADNIPRPGPPKSGQLSSLPAPTARPVSSLAEIAGEWDIVEFDGYRPPRLDPDGQRHAYVDIGAGGLKFAIACNYSGMSGSIGAGGVLIPANPDNGMQTEMGCGSEREARDKAFFRFFRSRPQVKLLPQGRVSMESSAHALLLERADIRWLKAGPSLGEITGTWRVISFTRFVNVGYQGWGAMFAPGRVRIDPSALSYSRCPELTVRYRYTADFTLSRETPARMPSPSCAGLSPAATEVEPMLATLLGQSPHAERVPGGRYILRSRNFAVVLASEADYRREFGEQAAEWERRPG